MCHHTLIIYDTKNPFVFKFTNKCFFLPLRNARAIGTSRKENGRKLSILGLSLSEISLRVPTPQPPVRHKDIGIT
jgi:hypothetical protein